MKTSDLRAVVHALLIGLLTIAFVVLKLTGVINWSWAWVVAPIWMPCVLLLIAVVVAFVHIFYTNYRNNKVIKQ